MTIGLLPVLSTAATSPSYILPVSVDLSASLLAYCFLPVLSIAATSPLYILFSTLTELGSTIVPLNLLAFLS
jgi:hypothetical protein